MVNEFKCQGYTLEPAPDIMAVPRPPTASCFLSDVDAPLNAIPVTSLLVCFLIAGLYVGSLYLVPILFQRIPVLWRVGALWSKLFGTILASLCSIAIARICLYAVPPPQPNDLTTCQLLGLSLDVDSVWWDGVLPVLAVLVLLLPLICANILTVMMFTGKGSSFLALCSWYLLEYVPAELKALFQGLLSLDALLYQALIIVEIMHFISVFNFCRARLLKRSRSVLVWLVYFD